MSDPVATVVEEPKTSSTTQTATITQVETPVVVTEPAPEVDLIAKVSQFKGTQDNIKNAPDQPELAAITDPVAREAAKVAVERMRRGMQSDYTKKIEDANRLVEQSKSWTPQRIQSELLNNPEFLAAAQLVAQPVNQNDRPLTQEEYSALNDSEKARLNLVPKMQNEINQIRQESNNQLIRANIAQKDATLSSRYADYDSKEIDKATIALGALNLADVREYIYKATQYDKHIKSAYEMGKQEAKGLTQQKIDVIAPNGVAATNNEGIPTKMKGESDQALFVRIAQFRLAQHRKR